MGYTMDPTWTQVTAVETNLMRVAVVSLPFWESWFFHGYNLRNMHRDRYVGRQQNTQVYTTRVRYDLRGVSDTTATAPPIQFDPAVITRQIRKINLTRLA
jgi:hypothetical protein